MKMASNGLIKSNIAKKYWMALTGLFLCIFLIAHLYGNLPLMIPHLMGASLESIRDSFNEYTFFMTHTPFIKIMSYVTYLSIIFHAIDGIVITRNNLKSREVNYAYNKPSSNSIWASRNMGVLGTIIFVFIVIHMGNFWARYHWGELTSYTTAGGMQVTDLFTYVIGEFKAGWYVALYVFCMVAIGFHLYHGFQSAFQSMGWRHPKYFPSILIFGKVFAVVIAAAFALIPIYVYLFY